MLRSWKTVSTLSLALAALAGCDKNQMKDPFGRQQYLAAEQANMKDAPLAETPDILPQTYFAAGNLFVSQGQIGKAIEQYRKAIAVNHKFAAAYHRLGRTLSVAGQHEEAAQALSQAVELKPNIALLRNDYGYELMYLERWAESEEQLRVATKVDPKFARAHINLGLVLSRTERFDEALAAFRTVLPETDARYNLGLLYRGQKRYVEAADEFRRVLELDPQFPAAKVQLDQLAAHLESSAMRQRDALAKTAPAVPPPARMFAPQPIDEPEIASETVASVAAEVEQPVAAGSVLGHFEPIVQASELAEQSGEPISETSVLAVVEFEDWAPEFEQAVMEFEEPADEARIAPAVQSSKLTESQPLRLPANELAEQLAAQLELDIRVFRNESLPSIVEKPVDLTEARASKPQKFDADWLQRELQTASNERDCLAAAEPLVLEALPPRLVRDEHFAPSTVAETPAEPAAVIEVVYRGDPLVEYFESRTTDWRADFRGLDALTGIIGNEIACLGDPLGPPDRIAAHQEDKPAGPSVRSSETEPAAVFGSPVHLNER